jgi:hypothetical protein
MGERKCAIDGCNALEFRTTGYCLRHNEAPKTTLIAGVNPINSDNLSDFTIIKTNENIKYNNTIWFLIGLIVVPIIMVIFSGLVHFIADITSIFIFIDIMYFIIMPISYLSGMIWGLTKNGPTGFTIGLSILPILFVLFILLIIYLFSVS